MGAALSLHWELGATVEQWHGGQAMCCQRLETAEPLNPALSPASSCQQGAAPWTAHGIEALDEPSQCKAVSQGCRKGPLGMALWGQC